MPTIRKDKLPVSSPDAAGFGRRLKAAMVGRHTQESLAESIGASVSGVKKWLSGSADPGWSYVVAAAAACEVSLDWLATGEGPQRLGSRGSARGSVSDSGERPLTRLDDGFVLVPRYNVEASAGPGALNGNEHVVDYMAFRQDFVRRVLRADPGNLVLITAVGDSMEPAIRAGDLLLVDRGIDRIMDDAIYVLGIGDELMVKRVQRFFDGGLMVKSDNAAIYKEQTVAPADVPRLRVAGRVRWIGRLI